MIEPHKNTREYGLSQERRIIDMVRNNPMSEFKIAEALGITRNATTIYMSRMRKQKRIRIVAYVKNPSGRPLPIFGAGAGDDLVYVPVRHRNTEKRPDPAEAMRAAILKLLEAPHLAGEIGEKLHRTRSIIARYIRQLRAEKKVRIASWRQVGERNGWAPVYKVGDMKDKRRPARKTDKERHMRKRADPEFRERENERRRFKRRLQKPQNPFSMLGL